MFRKKLVRYLLGKQEGQVLLLALIVLGLIGVVAVPLTSLVNSGLRNTGLYQTHAGDLYAADAGIQQALSKIINDPNIILDRQNNTYDKTYTYPSFTINNNNVAVSIHCNWFLSEVIRITNGAYPHDTWLGMSVTGTTDPTVYTDPVTGEQYSIYTVSFTYTQSGNKKIDQLGIWLPHGFNYFPGSSGKFAGNIDTAEPLITDAYGGTSLVWDVMPNFSFAHLGDVATQQFWFQPAGKTPKSAASWVKSQSSDIGYQWDNSIWWYSVTSTATDNANSRITSIDATISNNIGTSPGLTMVSYEINP